MIAAIVVVVLLLFIQFGASPIARSVINAKLAEMEGFTGSIGRVSLQVWRGSVVINDFKLLDAEHPDDLPVVSVRRAVMSSALRPLLQGKIGGHALIEGLQITAIKRERTEESDEEAAEKMKEARRQAKRWQRALREAVPMELTEIEVRDSQMRFIDRTYQPEVDIAIHDLQVKALNLRNRPEGDALPTTIDISGVTTGNGQLQIHVKADPMKEPLEFFTSFQLQDMSLPDLNPFLQAYAKVDVSQGRFDLYTEATAKGGRYEGYVKPFMENVEFESVHDESKSLGRRLVENVAEVTTKLLENPDTEKVATETPFSGTFDQNDVDLWATVENLLRNAFLQALQEGFGRG